MCWSLEKLMGEHGFLWGLFYLKCARFKELQVDATIGCTPTYPRVAFGFWIHSRAQPYKLLHVKTSSNHIQDKCHHLGKGCLHFYQASRSTFGCVSLGVTFPTGCQDQNAGNFRIETTPRHRTRIGNVFIHTDWPAAVGAVMQVQQFTCTRSFDALMHTFPGISS